MKGGSRICGISGQVHLGQCAPPAVYFSGNAVVRPDAYIIVPSANDEGFAALLGCVCFIFAADNNAAIDGVWRAKMDGLPALVLTISDEGGDLRGAVLFYLIRHDPGQPPHADPGIPEPLFNLKFDGRELSFQVSHRRAHPPRTANDPPVSFRLRITAPNEGLLLREGNETDQVRVLREN